VCHYFSFPAAKDPVPSGVWFANSLLLDGSAGVVLIISPSLLVAPVLWQASRHSGIDQVAIPRWPGGLFLMQTRENVDV
jgi:hypothetical protein